jgi:hypothetical protein
VPVYLYSNRCIKRFVLHNFIGMVQAFVSARNECLFGVEGEIYV